MAEQEEYVRLRADKLQTESRRDGKINWRSPEE